AAPLPPVICCTRSVMDAADELTTAAAPSSFSLDSYPLLLTTEITRILFAFAICVMMPDTEEFPADNNSQSPACKPAWCNKPQAVAGFNANCIAFSTGNVSCNTNNSFSGTITYSAHVFLNKKATKVPSASCTFVPT